MDIFVYISRFIYRIRYKLIFGSLLAVICAVYLTDFLPRRYSVTTTIFTGITSNTSLNDPNGSSDWNASNNAHDNIINLVQSKSILERISVALVAQHLMYGDPINNNNYILAKHYRELIEITPPEVLTLVDKKSFDNTVKNLLSYKKANPKNFIYGLFNWRHKHYSYEALKSISVQRKNTSDIIEISYLSDDPGIAVNTINFLNNELRISYETLLLSTSNDVVGYFNEQLALAKQKLTETEDELADFNMEHRIINYEEQTKHLAGLNNIFEDRYNEIMLLNRSSSALLKQLDKQLNTHTSLMKENVTFLSKLNEISNLTGSIAEIEIFKSDTTNNAALVDYKTRLNNAENKIKQITANIDTYKYSKEGVATKDMVTQWLNELINNTKSAAELEVMHKRKAEIEKEFDLYSPVGPNLKRKDREVKVAEESYLTLLRHLGLAHLKQKDILLNSGTLQIVSPPELPLLTLPRRRPLFVLAAFFGAIIFICGWYLLIELLDRTIRDSQRAERLTSGKVLGAFPRNERLKYRGYNKEVQRLAVTYLANALNNYVLPDKTTIINVLSIEQGEGKSMITSGLQEYWQDMGFSVKRITHHEDFNEESKRFLQSKSVYDLLPPQDEKPEIIIVEYAPVKMSSIPSDLLTEASVNLLVLNAQRAWRKSDQPLYEKLRKIIGDGALYIYLNNADRETVEEYTGQLPPYTKLRKYSYKFFNLGITAKNN